MIFPIIRLPTLAAWMNFSKLDFLSTLQ